MSLISNKETTHYSDEADMGKAFVGVSILIQVKKKKELFPEKWQYIHGKA